MRRTIALVAAMCLLGGCCSAAAAAGTSTLPAVAPVTSNGPGTTAAPAPPPPPQVTACSAAVECCRAFVSTVAPGTPGTLEVCEQVRQAGEGPQADLACRQMIDAWRQSLTSMGRPVPPQCQGTAANLPID